MTGTTLAIVALLAILTLLVGVVIGLAMGVRLGARLVRPHVDPETMRAWLPRGDDLQQVIDISCKVIDRFVGKGAPQDQVCQCRCKQLGSKRTKKR